MALLKKAATVAVLASAGVIASAGIAAACDTCHPDTRGHRAGSDDNLHQEGLIPVNALNNVNVSPNLGCALDRTVPNLTAQGLVGIVPVGVAANHLLEHANVNLLANGNISTDVYDDSCTSNEGSSQAGNNSHGSTGAGSSADVHKTGNEAGSYNSEDGEGAGGLLGGTGLLGTGL
jgi:hypothetical protein